MGGMRALGDGRGEGTISSLSAKWTDLTERRGMSREELRGKK